MVCVNMRILRFGKFSFEVGELVLFCSYFLLDNIFLEKDFFRIFFDIFSGKLSSLGHFYEILKIKSVEKGFIKNSFV